MMQLATPITPPALGSRRWVVLLLLLLLLFPVLRGTSSSHTFRLT
jgi:hypothetical protein